MRREENTLQTYDKVQLNDKTANSRGDLDSSCFEEMEFYAL